MRIANGFVLVTTTLLFAAHPTARAFAFAGGSVIAQYDFEDGTTQGWSGFCGATVTNTTAAAESGAHSLLVSNRSSACAGPSINLAGTLQPGATYTFSAWVKLAGTASANANLTVQQVDSVTGTNYVTVGNYTTPVSAAAWTQLSGTYVASANPTSLILYSQLVGDSTSSFYFDNVTLTLTAGAPGGPQDNSGISTNFEDGGLDGWSSRAGATLANSTADAHSGSHSLLVTNRTAAYDGPQISVDNKMYNGSSYSVSLWVKLAASATAADTLRLSLQTTLSGAVSYHTVIGNTPVPLGTWVNLSIPNYAMAFSYDPGQAYLYVESNSGAQSFYIDDFQLTYIPPVAIQTNIPSIYQTLEAYFPIGAEIDTTDISGVHAQLLSKHFNSIVSGNDMKWSSIEATEGTFTYTNADAEVAFAVGNNMKVRGHNLVWATGQQVPNWVFLEADGVTPLSASNPADVTLLTNRIRSHIYGEVQHFGTKVYAWDVVNEPLDPSQPDCLDHGPFYQILGKSYIDIALIAARGANPGAELFINDYNTDEPARLACMVGLAKDLLARGVPLDAIGHETHIAINSPTTAAIVNAIDTIALLGLDQQITEMDISVYNAGDNTSNFGANGGAVPAYLIAEQGYDYAGDFIAFRQLKGKISGVTLWGMADDDTWLDSFPIDRLNLPLPFDTNLQAKPAYWGIVDPTQLPGWGLAFAVSAKSGPQDARAWTITAANPSSGIAYNTQINGFSLVQTSGAACTPVVTPPSAYPVVVGNIAAGASASTSFSINFTGCSPVARFTLSMPWSSANGGQTSTLSSGNQFR